MSYSFTVTANDKVEALQKIEIEMGNVVRTQVAHKRDQAQALAVAKAFLGLLEDDKSKSVAVSMNGSLMGTWDGNDLTRVNSASISVSAWLINRL